MTKLCRICRQDRGIENFGPSKQTKDGLRSECYDCRKQEYYDNHEKMKESKRLDYIKHRELRLQEGKEKYQANKEKIKERTNKYYHSNKEIISEKNKVYRKENREEINKKKRDRWHKKRQEKLAAQEEFKKSLVTVEFPPDYKVCTKCHSLKHELEYHLMRKNESKRHPFCKSCQKERAKNYKAQHHDDIKLRSRQKYKENPEFYKAKKKRLRQSQKHKDNLKLPENRIVRNMSQYIRYSLNQEGLKKDGKATMKYVGCTREFFRNHIESQFLPGMTWENYGNKNGQWSLDHYIPREAFDLSKPEEQDVCFHWSNCQPMWHKENETKQDTMPDGRLARDTKHEYSLSQKQSLINNRILFLNFPKSLTQKP